MARSRQYADHAAKQRAYRARLAGAREEELQAKGIPPSPAVASLPGERRWRALLARAQTSLALACEEMEAYAEDRSEAWQQGERAARLHERVQGIEEVLERLEELEL